MTISPFTRAIIFATARRNSGPIAAIGVEFHQERIDAEHGRHDEYAAVSNQRVSLAIPSLSTRTKTSGIGLFTGQIGYAWNASLFYVKGGAAVTDNRFSILDTASGVELAAASATRWGGALGVGFEYGFAPNWSAGIEYDHLFMGHANNSFTSTNLNLVNFVNDRISQDVDMVTLRVN